MSGWNNTDHYWLLARTNSQRKITFNKNKFIYGQAEKGKTSECLFCEVCPCDIFNSNPPKSFQLNCFLGNRGLCQRNCRKTFIQSYLLSLTE